MDYKQLYGDFISLQAPEVVCYGQDVALAEFVFEVTGKVETQFGASVEMRTSGGFETRRAKSGKSIYQPTYESH